MSPEQVKGIAYTALSDIYSLGVTLFEMVTGKCPYQEITNLFELQSKIINETLPPTGKYYPDVTLKIQEAIRIATNKIPEKRFKSCNEFKRFLLEEEKVRPFILQEKAPVLQPKLPQPRTKTLPPPVNPPRLIEEKKKNNSWAFWLILFSILIVGGLIYSFHNQSNTTINQPKVTLTPPIKKDPTSGLITKHHDTLASAGKLSDSPGAKINEAENKIKINTQALSESKKQKIIPKENVISVLKGKKIQIKNANSRKKKTFPPDTTITQPLLSTTQLPPPTIHNVKGDLMHYLEQRKKFGGIQYNDISVINITSIGDVEYYKQSGNTSFLVELTIYNIARKCQVTYSQGGIIQIKPL
jgi:serine/threonine protein kinase